MTKNLFQQDVLFTRNEVEFDLNPTGEAMLEKHKDTDIKISYSKMVAEVRSNPIKIHNHKELFQEIFAFQKANLVFEDSDFYFLYGDKKLTDFGAVVLEVNIIYESDFKYTEVEMLILSPYEDSRIVSVNSSALGSSKWIENLGIKYIFEKSGIEFIKKSIQVMAKYAPVVEEYNYSGWALDKLNVYVLSRRLLYCKELRETTDEKEACAHVLNMLNLAEYRVTIPLLAVATLSLVQSKMISTTEFFKGVCCLLGQSQSFKTTVSALFFDFESGRTADISFDSSEAAIVRTIGNKRDSVTIVDDVKPPSTSAMRKTLISKMEKIIRMSADDSGGYQRAGQRNSIVSNKSRCITFVTAEEIPLDVYSTIARLLVLEINRKSVKKELLTYYQQKHHIYQEFIVNYILYVSAQGVDNYSANLKERFIQERDMLRNSLLDKDIAIDNRSNDMCTWLYLSFDEFLKYAALVKAIDQKQLEIFRGEVLMVFLNLITEQAERINELDDIRRFFKGLRYLLDSKEVRIERLQARNNCYAADDSKTAIGFSKKGLVYLKNKIAFQQIVFYYKRFGKDFAVSESTLRKMLNDNGYLVTKTSKSVVHRLSVNSESYQCIVFEETTFNKLKGDKNNDDSETKFSDDWLECQNANSYLGYGN